MGRVCQPLSWFSDGRSVVMQIASATPCRHQYFSWHLTATSSLGQTYGSPRSCVHSPGIWDIGVLWAVSPRVSRSPQRKMQDMFNSLLFQASAHISHRSIHFWIEHCNVTVTVTRCYCWTVTPLEIPTNVTAVIMQQWNISFDDKQIFHW